MSSLSVWINRGTTWSIVLMLWSSVAWGATLTWDANPEPDLAGYRVYECDQLPCGVDHGTATLLVTLGPVTSFDIGTPAATKFYFVTAYDFANNESGNSNVVAYDPSPGNKKGSNKDDADGGGKSNSGSRKK